MLKGHRKNYIANYVSKERGEGEEVVSLFSMKFLISIPRLWYDSASNFNFLLYCFCMEESNLRE